MQSVSYGPVAPENQDTKQVPASAPRRSALLVPLFGFVVILLGVGIWWSTREPDTSPTDTIAGTGDGAHMLSAPRRPPDTTPEPDTSPPGTTPDHHHHQEMGPDQDRIVLSWRHAQDLDLWVCDKSGLTECVSHTRKTASFGGGTITLAMDIWEGPGEETTDFRSVNSGTIEVWVHNYHQAFTSTLVLNSPAIVYVYCYECLDDDNQQKAGYVRSVTQNSDDVSIGFKKWWKVGEFTWPSGSMRAKWTTCVTDCYTRGPLYQTPAPTTSTPEPTSATPEP